MAGPYRTSRESKTKREFVMRAVEGDHIVVEEERKYTAEASGIAVDQCVDDLGTDLGVKGKWKGVRLG